MTLKLNLATQKSSRLVLLSGTKAVLTKGKGYLSTTFISVVPRWLDAEPTIPLEELIEISVAKIGRQHPSDGLKLTAKFADLASSLCNSKFHGKKIWQNFEITFRDRRETARRRYNARA
jgi:hypothetical protein